MKRMITAAVGSALLLASVARGSRIADVTRLGGQRTNVITGLGLVYGLRGTGDGGDFQPAIKRLAAMLSKFDDGTTSVLELGGVRNVALVALTATIPANGAKAGDALDVRITSVGSAKSLAGGQLYISPLQAPRPGKFPVLALANGMVSIEDEQTQTVGLVKKGVVLETDLPNEGIDKGQFSLVIDEPSASWTMSSNIAKIINDSEDGQLWAYAVSEKEVIVRIPPAEQEQPDGFISRVQRLPLPNVAGEARVQINERTGTLIITGDVEISPVIISHKGLTIATTIPKPVPSPLAPVTELTDFVAVDPANSGGAKLQDLIAALDQLKVPVADRIEIVKELHKTGKLHAKLLFE